LLRRLRQQEGVCRLAAAGVKPERLILDSFAADRPFRPGERGALLVNGLGATPPMELAVVARAALAQLAARGVAVERAGAGNFLTALDMPGFSLSFISLDAELLALLDAPTAAPAWPGPGISRGKAAIIAAPAKTAAAPQAAAEQTAAGLAVRQQASKAAHALIAAEPQLTVLDSIAGDDDLGASMQRGAEAVLDLPPEQFATAAGALAAIGEALRRAIAGSSGSFYATGFLRAARQLAGIAAPAAADWAAALNAAVAAICELGGAKPGDRTMVDALQAAADNLQARGGAAFGCGLATGSQSGRSSGRGD